jgi:hypothetical protein
LKDWLSRQLLGVHLLAIAAITVCVLMGLWQLGVYGAKHDDKIAEKSNAEPVDLLTVWGPDDPFTADLLDRRVRIHVRPGVGISGSAVFTVKRPNGQTWEAATVPVRGTKSAIVVVLGQVPVPPLIDWAGLPTRRPITAILQPSEPSGALSMAERVNHSKQDLFSGYALADDPDLAQMFKPVKPPEPHISWTVGLRNLAYAMQWWVFGLFAGFMWWRMATDAVAARRTPPDDVDGASGRP